MTAPQTSSACDWQISRTLVTDRAEYLLKSGVWSDCRFSFGIEPHQQIVEGHKVILAMSSPVFEAMLFGDMAERDLITITDIQPGAFKTLLHYIYTDKVVLSSFDEACEICYGAKKYMLPQLVEECLTYIWWKLCPTNVCKAYEFAKLIEDAHLMDSCLNLICKNTRHVLFKGLSGAAFSTILTIFEQDHLNIGSELDLFAGILRYAKQFKEDNASTSSEDNDNNIKGKLREILMKVRFLTLSPKEFAQMPGKSDLFTEWEKYAILMNICSMEPDTAMPAGFSTLRTKRQYKDNSVKKRYCYLELDENISPVKSYVLNSEMIFSCNKDIIIYGINIPTRVAITTPNVAYSEAYYAYVSDSNGTRLTYCRFDGVVYFGKRIDIMFRRPITLQRNKNYKIGVNFDKTHLYLIERYKKQQIFDDTVFEFLMDDPERISLVRTIIFSKS